MPDPVLSRRALNRALLARQMLLERVDLPIEHAVEHLVALQAQEPWDPYYQLWSRLQGFDPLELARLLEERRVVRATSMLRTTIHLMTADDWLALRPVLQVVSDRGFATGSPFGRQLAGMDIGEVLDAGREALAEQALTASQLRTILGARWPDRDASSLAYAVRYLLPLVQTTPRAVWGKRGQPVLATARLWLGRDVGTDTDPTDLILRYLRAFGPASVMDIQAWSWLTKLKPYVEALRPQLRTFRDENGKELFDVPDGSAARSGNAGTTPLPADVRQHRARAQGPQPDHRGPGDRLRRRQGPVGRGLRARRDPGRRVRLGRLADGPR